MARCINNGARMMTGSGSGKAYGRGKGERRESRCHLCAPGRNGGGVEKKIADRSRCRAKIQRGNFTHPERN